MWYAIYRMITVFLLITIGYPFMQTEAVFLKWGTSEEKIPFLRSFFDILDKENVSHKGVKKHYISGSAQFCPKNISQLGTMMKESGYISEKLIVLDLRLESHGFINDIPVSWTVKHNNANLGKSLDEVLADEQTKLELSLNSKELDGIPIYDISTERQLTEGLGWEYIRLPVQDHYKPDPEIVRIFLKLIQNNPDTWIHIHCAGGRGRTTLFLSLYDIYHNAGIITLDDILKRQRAINGQDLQKHLKHPHHDSYRQQMYTERLEFIEHFYQLRLEQLSQVGKLVTD